MSISSAAKIKKDLDNDIDLFKKDLNYIEFADDSIDETFINEHPLFILKALWANALYRKPLSDKLNHMVISCRSALLKVDTVEILNALTYGFYYPIVRNTFFDVSHYDCLPVYRPNILVHRRRFSRRRGILCTHL